MKTTAIAVLTALLSFFIGNVVVFAAASMFVQYFYEARMVALTHIFTLGWVSLMIIGVLRQLAPVAFGLNLRRPALMGVSVALLVAGLVTMVGGFATLAYAPAAVGTSLIFGAVLLVAAALLTSPRSSPLEMPHRHLFASLFYFIAAAVLGAWMGLAKGFDVPLLVPFHRMLFAHIHLAGAGWVGMMIFAVMSRLFPQPHLRRPLQARIRFAAFHVGLIGLTAGLLAGGNWYPVFGGILAIACIWYAAALIPVVREFSQPSDRSSAFIQMAFIWLVLVAAVGLWRCVANGPATAFDLQMQFSYGFVYMFGWLSFMILGMLYRIAPTHISKLLTARGVSASGLRRTFIDPELQIVVLICLVLGVAGSSAGILTANVLVFRVGWAAWLAGISGFVWSLVRVGLEVRRALAGKLPS